MALQRGIRLAVYTHVTKDEAGAFLKGFSLGKLRSIIPIAEGIENSNYALLTDSGRYILTLFEKRVREEELPFFMALMTHLHGKGIPCPLPVADSQGNTLHRLKGKPACIVTFLEGGWPRSLELWQIESLGNLLARMHLAVKDFQPKRANALSFEGWRAIQAKIAGRAEDIAVGLESVIEKELYYLETYWPKNLPSGVIHADIFPDNIFFHDGKLSGIIDFYFACNDSFAYELAIAINSWCFETHDAIDLRKVKSLIGEYRNQRPMTAEELAAIPVLARGAALRFLLTRAHDWLFRVEGAIVTPKDPMEYLSKLITLRQLATAADYGL